MPYIRCRFLMFFILLLSFSQNLFSGNLIYYIKPDVLYKGSFFMVLFKNLDSTKRYQIEFIGKETNQYEVHAAKPLTLKLIAIPLSSPDKVRLVLKEDGEPVMEDFFKLSTKPVPSLSITVDQNYVTPPAELIQRINEEQRLIQKVKKIVLDKIYFFQEPGYPVEPFEPSTSFGSKRVFNKVSESIHYGLDLNARAGVPIRCVFNGVVKLCQDLYFSGNTVFVHHGDNLLSMYCHMEKMSVTNNQFVKKGQVLGLVGATGRVTGPHLHMGVFVNSIAVDPLSLWEILK